MDETYQIIAGKADGVLDFGDFAKLRCKCRSLLFIDGHRDVESTGCAVIALEWQAVLLCLLLDRACNRSIIIECS
jgi:hypothetical protein